MSGPRRLVSGGSAIDRSRTIGFRFNGRRYCGHPGDTLASALLANGVRVVARSFKYHRPRGIVAAGPEEPNALVRIGRGAAAIPNLKATEIPLVEGLEASSVNCWPGPAVDIGGVIQLFSAFLPAGFYYKTFMWPAWHWFEGAIRRAAGLGKAPTGSDPTSYLHAHLHCDTVVIGGGEAGIAAAKQAAGKGERVVLVESGVPVADPGPGVTVLAGTTAFGSYDHGLIAAIEQSSDVGGRQRLVHIRAGRIVTATGAIERPIVFPGNDRPGVMLAASVSRYLDAYGVLCGREIVVFTNNNSVYPGIGRLCAAGARVTVIDARADPEEAAAARAAGATVRTDTLVAAAHGASGVTRVNLIAGDGREAGSLSCDCVAVSGGWSPTVHLFSQSGGRLLWSDQGGMFVPAAASGGTLAVGAAAGDLGSGYAATPVWRVPAPGKAFVDQANDVTAADIALAARENYISVEHLKRYTTLGMAPDQGKTSNVNGLAIMGLETGRTPDRVGTTKFRPPYVPVTIGALAGLSVGQLYRPIRHLPAHSWHLAQGAVFEDHGGWARPTAYPRPGETWEAAVRREIIAVRSAVGIFDASPLGKIEVVGPDAGRFLDRMYVGSVSNLRRGRARYGLMLNENGGVIDDGIYVRREAHSFLLNTTSGGAGRIAAMLDEWLQCEWTDLDVTTMPVTTAWATFVLSGPAARTVLEAAGIDIDLDNFPHMSFSECRIAGVAARLLRASFTGELSYEVSVATSFAGGIAKILHSAGASAGIASYGVEALTRLRAERGNIIVGVDTEATTLPGDLGMAHGIAKKESDFIGRRSLARPDATRDDRLQLAGLRSDERDPLPVGGQILCGDAVPGDTDGYVTTSFDSPWLGYPIALALVRRGTARYGEKVTIFDMGKRYRATIVDHRFLDPEGVRMRG